MPYNAFRTAGALVWFWMYGSEESGLPPTALIGIIMHFSIINTPPASGLKLPGRGHTADSKVQAAWHRSVGFLFVFLKFGSPQQKASSQIRPMHSSGSRMAERTSQHAQFGVPCARAKVVLASHFEHVQHARFGNSRTHLYLFWKIIKKIVST